MNKKRGFSLIELLAVIVVLAIILAIAVPKVLASINTASKKAFTSDVDQFVGIAKLEYNEKLEGNKKDIYYTFKDGNQVDVTEENVLHFKGESPYEGYILITEDGKVELELVSSNQKWCASKELDDEKAIVDKCSVKEKKAINLTIATINTTRSITVTASPSNLDKYYFSINDGKFQESKENIKIYNKLDKNKTYKIKVKGCKKNSKCETVEKEVTLPDLNAPKYTVTNDPKNQTESKGWATSRTVTINYNQTKDENTDYSTLINQYIYASTEADLYQKLINNNWTNCGQNTIVSSCTLPEFTSEVFIIARVTDNHNTVSQSSILHLTNFDTEKPTAPVITGGSSSWTSTSRTISVETASQAKSGIKKYQYYVSTSSEEPSGDSWKDCSTSKTTQKFTKNGEYYIFFKAISNVGLESDPSNSQVVKVDNITPTVTLSATKTSSGSSVASNTWSNETLNFTFTKGTTGSSGSTIYYCQDTTNTCTPSTKATSGTTITTWASTTGTYYIRYYVKSGSGRESSVETYTAKVDTTPPTVPTSVIRYDSNSGTKRKNEDSWTNKTLWWGNFSSTDTQSGVDHYEYSTKCSGSKSGNLTTSYTYSSDKNTFYCIRAVDKVGNASSWSDKYYFKIDKTAPTVPTSVIRYDSNSGTERKNEDSWTNKTLWWGNFSSTDTQSGVDHYEYSTKCSGSKSGNLTTSYTYSSDQNTTYCIRAIDKVGNASSWSDKYYFKIDKKLPTVSYNIPGAAYTSTQDLKITGSDTNFDYMNVHVYKYDGSSWVLYSGKTVISSGTSETYSVSLTTGRWIVYTQVYDKAGNRQNQTPDNGYGWYYQEYIIAQPKVTYNVALMGAGKWSSGSNGTTAGSEGKSQAIDQFELSFDNGLASTSVLSGKIHYQLHKQSCGDLAADSNTCIVNGYERNTGLRIEAIKIYLSGDIAKYYDVVYRVHVQSQGWLGWAKNGNWVGSKGLCKRIEAIQIKIVPKGTQDTSNNYFLEGVENNCAASDDSGKSTTGDTSTPKCVWRDSTDYKEGVSVWYCRQNLGGTCVSGTTSGGNCNCRYSTGTERVCN